MDGETHVGKPADCGADERRQFARLVRQGFNAVIETLPRRIGAASHLAYHALPDGSLVAVAAMKSPSAEYRDAVFFRAKATEDPIAYERELGWVYVVPEHRGSQIGRRLCERLVARSPSARMFATTRVENTRMTRILTSLGFRSVGRPFQRRNEVLVLFCRG